MYSQRYTAYHSGGSHNKHDYFSQILIVLFVMKTNQMHYLSLIYFLNQPLHDWEMFIVHHQEVFTVYVQQLVRIISLRWLAAGRVKMEQQPVNLKE
jgi:hypothetical protein